jgi:hypothetical protein
MSINEFLELEYKDQLHLINRSGKLKKSIIVNDYQYTLYKVKSIYVELKRKVKELSFEQITPMYYHDLPEQYKAVNGTVFKKRFSSGK